MNHKNLAVKQAEMLAKKCEIFADNLHINKLKQNLLDSIDFCLNNALARPLIITLTGGTGTGKSYIFSRLYGQESISPSSDSVRGFTKKPFISACEADRPFLGLGEDVHFLPGIIQGAVLIDSPDLDSATQENVAYAKKLIEASDILVYVTTPDKRSNFDVNKTIMEWAYRKHWFFVMNKIDTATDVAEENLRKDFSERISSLGFKTDKNSLFLFSARNQESFEFNRFKDAIFSKKSMQQNRALRKLACLRSLRHALGNSGNDLGNILKKLNGHQEKISDRLKAAQEKVLSETNLCLLANQARASEVLRHLSGRRSFFLFPYIYVANHLNSGVSTAETAISISQAIKNDSEFKSCKIDETRVLDDLNLNPDISEDETELQASPQAALEIQSRLTTFAAGISTSKTLALYCFLANLLPAIFLIQALYRAFATWITGTWLPLDFFIHAIILTAGSTVPGYILFSKGVARLSSMDDMREFRQPMVAPQIIKVHKQIETLARLEAELRHRLDTEINKNENQLDNTSLGISRSTV